MSLIKRAVANVRDDEHAEKAISRAVALATNNSSGATYEVNPSSPFHQTGGGTPTVAPLPRDNSFDSLFGPGIPFVPDPLDPTGPNGRTPPRRSQYLVAWNLQLLDRQVPWTMLKWLAEGCDVVNRCIQLVQDGVVGRHWSWGFSESVIEQIMQENNEPNHARAMNLARDKYGVELDRVKKFFENPDHRMGQTFSQWLTELVWNHLVYDGIAVYPQYNLGGDLEALSLIDPSTIKILRDNQGYKPLPPSPAYQQILYGFPRGEYQSQGSDDDDVAAEFLNDQLSYYIRRQRPETVYGYPQVEEVMTIATTYLARQNWMAAEYANGVMPKTFMTTAETETWTPEQLAYYEQIMNDRLSGQTQRRQQMFMLRPGMKPEWAPQIDEHYKSDYDNFLIIQMGSKFGVPGTQLGVQAKAGLSGGKQMEGESDQTEHYVMGALVNFIIDIQNDLARRYLGVGREITATCKDESQSTSDLVEQSNADKTTVSFGGLTLNDYRAKNGLPLYDAPEADEPMIVTATGPVYLKGTLAVQDNNTENALHPPEPPKQIMVGPDGKPLPMQPTGGTDGASNSDANSGLQSVPGGDGKSASKPAGSSGSSGTSGSSNKLDSNGSSTGKTTTNSDSKSGTSDNSDKSATSKELAAFIRFAKSRHDKGAWRNFEFLRTEPVFAGQLNTLGGDGNLGLIKAMASNPVAAGLIVKAKDTERVLMVQRSINNQNTTAAGLWEFPGGKLDGNDTAYEAAVREWEEEVGVSLPDGEVFDSWTTPNGRYMAFVYVIKQESDIELNEARGLDGTGDNEIENVAWWNINDLQNNPAIRAEIQSADWAILGHAKSVAVVPFTPEPTFDLSKAAEVVADRLHSEMDRLRQSYGLLNDVKDFLKADNKTPPPEIHIHNDLPKAPNVHLHADFAPQVEVDARSTHNNEHTIDATSQHDHHIDVHPANVTVEKADAPIVNVTPEIHVDGPTVNVEPTPVTVKTPKVTVNVPDSQPRSSTVKRQDDGSVVIERS